MIVSEKIKITEKIRIDDIQKMYEKIKNNSVYGKISQSSLDTIITNEHSIYSIWKRNGYN